MFDVTHAIAARVEREVAAPTRDALLAQLPDGTIPPTLSQRLFLWNRERQSKAAESAIDVRPVADAESYRIAIDLPSV